MAPQIIYQVMASSTSARLTPKHKEAIERSVVKCMLCRVQIDAREEDAAYGFDDGVFEGALIRAEPVMAKVNGHPTECI